MSVSSHRASPSPSALSTHEGSRAWCQDCDGRVPATEAAHRQSAHCLEQPQEQLLRPLSTPTMVSNRLHTAYCTPPSASSMPLAAAAAAATSTAALADGSRRTTPAAPGTAIVIDPALAPYPASAPDPAFAPDPASGEQHANLCFIDEVRAIARGFIVPPPDIELESERSNPGFIDNIRGIATGSPPDIEHGSERSNVCFIDAVRDTAMGVNSNASNL